MSSQKLADHIRVDRYGDFLLTDAIRPGLQVPVVPREGYRVDVFRDKRARVHVPVLAAAVSRERLFDVFLDLLPPLGEAVDVVLETSHHTEGSSHQDLFREEIDLPVLMSHFCDFEDLLLNDGCAGTAVISTIAPMEVQFDEHKLLVVYAHDLKPFEEIMRRHGISAGRQAQAHYRGRAPAQHRSPPHQRLRRALHAHRRQRTGGTGELVETLTSLSSAARSASKGPCSRCGLRNLFLHHSCRMRRSSRRVEPGYSRSRNPFRQCQVTLESLVGMNVLART